MKKIKITCNYDLANLTIFNNIVPDTNITMSYGSIILNENKGYSVFTDTESIINTNNFIQETITFFFNDGNITGVSSWTGSNLFLPNSVHKFTVIGCTDKYFGYSGNFTIKVLESTQRICCIKLYKN